MSIKKIIEANQTPTVVPAPEKVTSATTPQAPPATSQTGDIARMITDQLASLTESQLANLRNKIAQGVSTQQQIIKNAPLESAPLIAESELRKGEELRSVLERNANLGDRGGIGRQAALETQLSGDERLNAIKLREQSVIDNANQEIARLQSEGAFAEADIIAQNKAQELQLLREEAIRLEGIAREDKLASERLLEKQSAQEREDFQNTIASRYNDLQAFANELREQGAEQWKIDQVLAARQQKIAEQGLDQQGRPLPVDNTQNLIE